MRAGLVTFGDGSLAYRRASARVTSQAESFDTFQVQVGLTKKILQKDLYSESQLVHWGEPFLGFYAWKPLVLIWALRQFPKEVDLIYYVDSGSWVNVTPRSKVKLIEDLQFVYEKGGLGFSSGCLERHYSKIELLNVMSVTNEQLNSTQFAGGQWILRRDFAEDFCHKWWQLATQFNLINNDLDSSLQFKDFIAHRNDQSILSLLFKQFGIAMSKSKIDIHPALNKIGELEQSIPFWAARHRSGSLSMSMHPARRAIRAIEQNLP